MESLPNEIIQTVVNEVKNLHDIRPCREVNSKWNVFALKALYKKNQVVGFTQNSELILFLSTFNQTATLFPFSCFAFYFKSCYENHEKCQLKISDVILFFRLHGCHVRDLQLNLPITNLNDVLDLLQSTPNLSYLELHLTANRRQYADFHKLAIVPPALPKLKTLEFYLRVAEFPLKLPVLQGFISAAPNLNNLYLKFGYDASLKHLSEVWEVVKNVPCVSVTKGKIEFCVQDPLDVEYTKQKCGFTGLTLLIDRVEKEHANELKLFQNWLESQSFSLKTLSLDCYTKNFWLPRLNALTTLELRFEEEEREGFSALQPINAEDLPELNKIVLENYSTIYGLFNAEIFPRVKEFSVGPAYDGLKIPVNWDQIFPNLEVLQLVDLNSEQMKPFIQRMTNVIELKFYGNWQEQFCRGKQFYEKESDAIQKILGRYLVTKENENNTSLANFTKLKRIRFDSNSVLVPVIYSIRQMKSLELITICHSLRRQHKQPEIMSLLKSCHADVIVELPEN